MIFPEFKPFIDLGFITIHYYGLAYVLAWFIAFKLAYKNTWSKDDIDSLLINGFVGVILGGRIGDVLFYHFNEFVANPLYLFAIKDGGMSFHGGLLGVMIAIIITAYKQKRTFLEVADFAAPLVPIGLGIGRIANFINGELWGRETDVFWSVVYKGVARHPSQLYEAFLEGFVLYFIVKASKTKTATFLIFYGIFRFLIEFVREPDGYVWIFTKGQALCIPMIVLGLIIRVKQMKQLNNIRR